MPDQRDDAGDEIEGADPTKPTIVTVIGRKGSGKSILGAFWWDSYPFDELCLNIARDAVVGPGCTYISELPDKFPAPQKDQDRTRTKLVYEPDPGSPTYDDDLDRAVGLALNNPAGRTLLWIDERGEFTVHPGPQMRRALNMSRHYGLSLLTCGPRAVNIDPLLIGQADYLFIFELPTVSDRRRIAETIGVDLNELSQAIFALPPHAYLRWDAKARDMVQYPPLPKRMVDRLQRATQQSRPAAAPLFE